MIKNSYTKELDLKDHSKIEGGKSLLQVCIENENTEQETWQLKELMKCLLQHEDTELDIMDHNDEWKLLTFCYKNKKHQAFDLIIQHALGRIDINKKNKDGSTIYGTLFYNNSMSFYTNNGFKPSEKLTKLLEIFNSTIDKNIPQIKLDS